MAKLTGKRVLITGASAGIGMALATALASQGCKLFLVARRESKLKELASELGDNAFVIAGDINHAETFEKIRKVTEENVDILFNNAGLALGRDPVASLSLNDMDEMIDTNIRANFRMIREVLPWMIKKGGGDIVNVCSVAGHYSYPGGSVYCATKFAVNAFTKVLREETCGQNIRVMQLSPGMVNTEFSTVRFKGDTNTADNVYAGIDPLTAQDMAEMVVFMLERPRHVVIDEIITMPLQQGAITTVARRM